MSRKSKHGKKSEFAVLDLFEKKKTLTPDEINAFMSNNYASKYVCYLRIAGYDFDVNKDGRTVVSYTFKGKSKGTTKKPATTVPTVSKSKPEKLAKVKNTVAKKPKVSVEEKLLQELDMMPLQKDFSSSSFSIDSEWDSVDNVDVTSLVR